MWILCEKVQLILAVKTTRDLGKKENRNRQILCVKRAVELRRDVRSHVSSLR